MSLHDEKASLKGELLQAVNHIDRIYSYYLEFRTDYPKNGAMQKGYDLVLPADIITFLDRIDVG